MKNLAGDKNCETTISDELLRAEIKMVKVPGGENSEVPSSIGGELGPFKFTRAWTYWVARGLMPLDVAKEIFKHPEGAATVRIAGHCGCVGPEAPWVTWLAPTGGILYLKETYEGDKKKFSSSGLWDNMQRNIDNGMYVVSSDFNKDGKPYITSYHIDTQAGLLLFSMMVKKYGVDTDPELLALSEKCRAFKNF